MSQIGAKLYLILFVFNEVIPVVLLLNKSIVIYVFRIYEVLSVLSIVKKYLISNQRRLGICKSNTRILNTL